MKEEKNIAEYLLRVDGIGNAIRGIVGVIKEREVVDKVLRTLPMKYDSKVSTLEERDDLDLMTVDELHGIFSAYDKRTRQYGPSNKEATFKALSKNQSENLDDEETLFIKKLEKGIGKYKGKFPLKCFNCGRTGHFANKCPYPKQEESDHEESCCHKCKAMDKKFKKKKETSIPKNIVTMKVKM